MCSSEINIFLSRYDPAPQGTPEWFARFAQSLGASTASAVLGHHRSLSGTDVVNRWLGKERPFINTTIAMQHGTFCESLARTAVQSIINMPIYETGAFCYDNMHHYSPDGIFFPGPCKKKGAALELKCPYTRPIDQRMEITPEYNDQLQYTLLLDERLDYVLFVEMCWVYGQPAPGADVYAIGSTSAETPSAAELCAHNCVYSTELLSSQNAPTKWDISFTEAGRRLIDNLFGTFVNETGPPLDCIGNIGRPDFVYHCRSITARVQHRKPQWGSLFLEHLYPLYRKFRRLQK